MDGTNPPKVVSGASPTVTAGSALTAPEAEEPGAFGPAPWLRLFALGTAMAAAGLVWIALAGNDRPPLFLAAAGVAGSLAGLVWSQAARWRRAAVTAAFDTAQDAHLVVGRHGRVLAANRPARRLFGDRIRNLAVVEEALSEDMEALTRFRRLRQESEAGASLT